MQHASSRRSKQPRFLSRNPHYHSSSSRHQVTARAGFNFRPFLAGELTRAVTRRGALRWLLCETGHQRPLPSSPRQGSEERRERQCPRQGRARDGDYADPHTSESPRIMSRRRGRRARRPAPSRILQRRRHNQSQLRAFLACVRWTALLEDSRFANACASMKTQRPLPRLASGPRPG